MAKLKFGSAAYRKKYLGQGRKKKRTNRPKRNPPVRYRVEPSGREFVKKSAATKAARAEARRDGRARIEDLLLGRHVATYEGSGFLSGPQSRRVRRVNSPRKKKRARVKEMIRQNPPRKWMNVRAVRVVRKGGRDILEVKK